MLDIAFEFAGSFEGVVDQFNVLSNPTSLAFGPDGRLYVTVQTGSIHAFVVEERDGIWVATEHELIVDDNGAEAVKSIQNHFDDGSEKAASDRQVTGIVVTGTETEPVLYVSSSDPSISNNGELNLDTNSGVLSKVSWNATTGNWDVVDLVRGLPRSEENHAVNGMTLSEDGTSLLLQVGGSTNNGAPSSFFSYTAEYALSAAILEIDLAALDAMPVQIDPEGGQGDAARAFVYDLPTLDDPNTENVTDGVGEDANGMDEAGPWGGNDGLNMAILPADAPLRIYADGLRNAYDLAQTLNGNIYTVDNGSNGGIGDIAAIEDSDDDGDGIANEAINTPLNGGFGEGEPLLQIIEGGYYYHGNSVRSNQNQSWTVYDDDGNPDANVDVNFVADISALVPDGVLIPDGFLIDPSRFAYAPGVSLADVSQQELEDRLFLSGITIDSDLLEQNDPDGDGQGQQAIAILGSSTNGIVTYNSGGQAFNGVLDGALFVAQFNDNVTLLNINDAGTALDPIMSSGPDGIFGTADDEVQDEDGVLFVANNSLGVPLGNPLDVTVGPNGTLWVAEIGDNDITVLAPSVSAAAADTDSDNDGIENAFDPFIRDASNGTGVTVIPNQTLLWDFDADQDGNLPGEDGFGGGLTGVMIDNLTDFEEFFQSPSTVAGQDIQLDNVKFITAAGGGTTIVENVSNGDPFETSNNGAFLFHTGLVAAPNVETMNIRWVVGNPGDALTGDGQQIGGYIGTGDQSDYLKLVAVAGRSEGEFYIVLEFGDTAQEFYFQADDLFDVAEIDGNDIIIDLDIDLATGLATPTFTYETATGPDAIVAATEVDLSGSVILDALKGDFTVQGQSSGLAVGLFSSNVGQSPQDTFQAIFKDIEVTATGAESGTLYRVNAGGPLIAATDDGPDWAADTSGAPSPFLIEAGTNLTASGGVTPGATVSDEVPAALFSTERFDFSFDPAVQYAFDVVPGGTYDVRLFLGNSFLGTSEAGDRVFDVAIEGDVLPNLDNIDLSAQFGHLVGGVISNTVTVSDGTLNIEFLHGVENPLINGIEIVQIGGGDPDPDPDPDPISVSILGGDQTVAEGDGSVLISLLASETVPIGDQVDITYTIEGISAMPQADFAPDESLNGAGTAVFTGTATIVGGSADLQLPIDILQDLDVEGPETFAVTLQSVSQGYSIGAAATVVTIQDDDFDDEGDGGPLYRVNAGGPLVAATDGGPDWMADTSGAPSPFLIETGTNLTAGGSVTPGATVPSEAPAALFATERFDFSFDPAMEYAFDVTPGGSYEVRLYLGNSFIGTSEVGDRVFDVAIEDDVLANLDDIDLSARFGHSVGGVISNTVTVSDGTLNIEFLHGVENPLINAIEIISLQGDAPSIDTLFGAAIEISDDRLNPTFGGVLADGDNLVTATQEGESGENGVRDRDYFTFTVPDGKVLTGIFLEDFTNENPTSPDGFLAIQTGDQITVDPFTGQADAGTDPLLGALIYGFGTSATENLLETMAEGGIVDPATGFALPGFTTPLTGDVSVWLNQGAGPGTPTLRFVVEDEVDPDPQPDPGTVGEILNGLTDVDDDGVYGAGATGAALLTVLDGNNNPQTSNFGSSSFQLTNAGDKEIAAVAIDFRSAVFGDSVVDIDGSAGDIFPKVFNIDDDGGTGGFVTQSDAYLFAGDDPLPNTTGTGLASSGGFRGVLVKFDGTGFTDGETVGFSGDMDPNSIAGLNKFDANGVDTGAINNWDVGGVSGSELIGSTFTVLFDDGSTATGYLHSDNSQSGSIGEATENQSQRTATLSIETDGATLASGETGTYGGDAPVITVSGTPGDTVRVVMQKGFNPVTNDNSGVATLVADRLLAAQPDFLANNSFDLQTVDVVIPANGSITLAVGAFDYNGTISGETFVGDDLQPLAFSAAVIAPASDNTPDVLEGDDSVALGPVSAPIYLANNGSAVGAVVDPDPDPMLIVQSGTVTAQQANATSFTRIDFDQAMIDPVVVMGPVSSNGGDPTTLRILEIDQGGFEFQIDDFDYLGAFHVAETMSWVAVERGVHVLSDGAIIEAGTASVSNAAQAVDLSGAFTSGEVAVVAQATTANDASAVTDRISDVDENGFVVRLQEQELSDGLLAAEDVDWVAFSTGDFLDFEASVYVNALDEQADTFSFLSRGSDEAFLADMQSFRGGDTAVLRYDDLSNSEVTLRVEEERSRENEINHTFESIALLSVNDLIFI